jgi:hypothetical protein
MHTCMPNACCKLNAKQPVGVAFQLKVTGIKIDVTPRAKNLTESQMP